MLSSNQAFSHLNIDNFNIKIINHVLHDQLVSWANYCRMVKWKTAVLICWTLTC